MYCSCCFALARNAYSADRAVIVSQVPNAPRRGGTAARAACGELLANAEFVFEQLLELAAQHPANYIIDGSKWYVGAVQEV